jgi:hypothetical protein
MGILLTDKGVAEGGWHALRKSLAFPMSSLWL